MTKKSVKEEELQKKVEDLENKWRRALADYQNLEKRIEAQRSDFAKNAARDLILRLLSVGDTLNLAAAHLKDSGLDLAVRGFWQALENEGLEKIEVQEKEFNPEEMECVDVVLGKEENKVAQEVRSGYRLNGKVLRPAQVKVYKEKIEEKAEKLAKEELQKGDYM